MEDPARVRASGFGEYSIDVEIFAYVGIADRNDFFGAQEDVILRIMDIVKKTRTAFALPSRTVYRSRDEGLDSQRQAVAPKGSPDDQPRTGSRIDQWRSGFNRV